MAKLSAVWLVATFGLLTGCSDDGAGPDSTADAGSDLATVDVRVADGVQPDGPGADATDPDGPASDLPLVDGTPADQQPMDSLTPDAPSSCKHPQVTKSCSGSWCTIPAGCFMMGSPTGEKCRFISETQHPVTLTHKFEIPATEVTRSQFKALMGYDLSLNASCGQSCPVENVSWHEAAAYCNALSKQKNLGECYVCSGTQQSASCAPATAYLGAKMYDCPGYRLPHEAEWEYAYRAGTKTAYYNGAITNCTGADSKANAIGWYKHNSGQSPHVTGSKTANAWGLHDMPGNVWEWCQDWNQGFMNPTAVTNPSGPSTGTDRTLRGGGWSSSPAVLRAADRGNVSSKPRGDDIGFRCVRSLP